MYNSIVQMAVDDKVLTKKELLQRIEEVRLKYELTVQDHDLVLKELGVSKQQYLQFTQNQIGSVERKSDTASLMQCVVCLDARSDHVILPCMHLCLCGDCTPFYKTQHSDLLCPKCRTSVKTVTKVFM